MPTFRLSTGKNVSPLQRPRIAAARGPRISSTAVWSFPSSSELQIQPELEGQLWFTPISNELLLDFSHSYMEPQDLHDTQVRLVASERPSEKLGVLDAGALSSKLYAPPEGKPIIGPAPFPRSYTPVSRRGELIAEDIPGPMDLLQAVLGAPLVSTRIEPLLMPENLRKHQWEAVGELLDHEAFMLADEPGMGKTVSMCVALSTLFRQRRARRALVVCPEFNRHMWAAQMYTWAPSLLMTVIRGDQAQRTLDWNTPAHVYLADYQTMAADIAAGLPTEQALEFDLVVLDGFRAVHFYEEAVSSALEKLQVKMRWAMAGALPQKAEEWLSIFGYLTPEATRGKAHDTSPDLRRQFMANVLRRKKADLVSELPRHTRHELWLDLSEQQAIAYEEALATERRRLGMLGGAVTLTHIGAAVDRLKQVCNFDPDFLDGAKVRALVNLTEEITAISGKMVVFSQYKEESLDRLHPVMEAFGTLRIDSETPEAKRDELLASFREDELWHVLLAELSVRTDGQPLTQATYIVHFDHGWNPAVRHRAEQRLHPGLGPSLPVDVYEFWVAGTIDEKLHALLSERGLLPSQVPQDTQPVELEDRLTINEWLRDVFEISEVKRPPRRAPTPVIGTGELPGTAMLRTHLAELTGEELMAEVALLMDALGYPQAEILGEPDETGGYLLARRHEEGEEERVLVQCIHAEKNVGVGEGRNLLKSLEERDDCVGAYLVASTDFTPACKKLAEESGGSLSLISGVELRRHLRILGRL